MENKLHLRPLARLSSSILSTITLLVVGTLHAAPLVSEAFDYPDGPLKGCSGGIGFGAPWVSPASVSNHAVIVNSKTNGARRILEQEIPIDTPIYAAVTLTLNGASEPKANIAVPFYLNWKDQGDIAALSLSRGSWLISIADKTNKRFGRHTPGESVRCVLRLERTAPDEIIVKAWIAPTGVEKSDMTAFVIGPLPPDARLTSVGLRIWTRETEASAAFSDLRIGSSWEDVADASPQTKP